MHYCFVPGWVREFLLVYRYFQVPWYIMGFFSGRTFIKFLAYFFLQGIGFSVGTVPENKAIRRIPGLWSKDGLGIPLFEIFHTARLK